MIKTFAPEEVIASFFLPSNSPISWLSLWARLLKRSHFLLLNYLPDAHCNVPAPKQNIKWSFIWIHGGSTQFLMRKWLFLAYSKSSFLNMVCCWSLENSDFSLISCDDLFTSFFPPSTNFGNSKGALNFVYSNCWQWEWIWAWAWIGCFSNSELFFFPCIYCFNNDELANDI